MQDTLEMPIPHTVILWWGKSLIYSDKEHYILQANSIDFVYIRSIFPGALHSSDT
jgi:hypothetical protein